MPPYLRFALFCLFASQHLATAEIVTGDQKFKDNGGNTFGNICYFYDDAKQSDACDTVVMVGVGTAMTTKDYSAISNQMVEGRSVVTIITDHFPGFIRKTSGPKKIVIEGHSASGQAAWNSLPHLNFQPDAFLGLDQFSLSPNDDFDLPTLNFGFTKTTSGVKTTQAAKANYQASEKDHRVFYQIDNSNPSALGYCAFTDTGCFGPICPAGAGSETVRE